MKKQVMIALLAVIAVSILPGCGKSKNEGSPFPGGPGGPPGGPVVTPTGGNSLQLSNASGRVTGAIYLNTGGVGGYLYTRHSPFGDRVDLYVSTAPNGYGTGYTTVAASATATLSTQTSQLFQYYCGSQPTVVEFYQNQLTPGNIPESVVLWAQMANGQWCQSGAL